MIALVDNLPADHGHMQVRNPRVVPLAWFSAAWEEQLAVLGPDPWVYGLDETNRKNLETAIRYTRQQGLITREIPLSELFTNSDGAPAVEKGHI